MDKKELMARTKMFAIRIFKFVGKIKRNKEVDVIAYQIFKSASSVAANYRAVNRAKSEIDFLHKLKVVDEEADETLFWLEFIEELELQCDLEELQSLKKEVNELVSIFSAAIKTLKSRSSGSSR